MRSLPCSQAARLARQRLSRLRRPRLNHARVWSAAHFAACEVHGPESVVKALTPDLLSMVGRALIRRGEILFHVDVTDGRLRLFPCRLARYFR